MGAHTTANEGKRVTVFLKNGQRFTAKLQSIHSRFYVFRGVGKVAKEIIRAIMIAR